MNKIIITEEQYKEYERIRVSGVTNMWDTKIICGLTNLKPEQVNEIRRDYGALREWFTGV